MKIVFFGDSYTQGTPYPTDYKDIWPNIVAKHFGADAVNKYVAGGSNHAIMRKYIEFFRQDSCDLAIIMWSHWNRNEVHVNEKVYQMQPASKSFPTDYTNEYYKNRNLQVDWEDFLDKIWLCGKIGVGNLLQGCCFEIDKTFDKPKHWFPHNMHGMALKKTVCGHPHISEHKNIARAFIKHIEDCELL